LQKLAKRAFKGFIINTQSCLIDKLERSKGEELFKIRVYKKAMSAWKSLVHERKIEDNRLSEIKKKLEYKAKLILMRKWKESVLFTQVRRAQNFTAIYVYKKKLQKKVLDSFKIHNSAFKFDKLRWRNATRFEQLKLLTTAFKTLHWYKNKKKVLYQEQHKIDAVYSTLAKKRGLKMFIKNTKEMIHRRRLNECANKFYSHQLHLKYFEMFKTYHMIRKGIKNQEFCIVNYYKERTMCNIFGNLKQYTKDKKEYRTNALIFKHRGYQRKLIYLWRVVSYYE
jgi:hypothetical protein